MEELVDTYGMAAHTRDCQPQGQLLELYNQDGFQLTTASLIVLALCVTAYAQHMRVPL